MHVKLWLEMLHRILNQNKTLKMAHHKGGGDGGFFAAVPFSFVQALPVWNAPKINPDNPWPCDPKASQSPLTVIVLQSLIWWASVPSSSSSLASFKHFGTSVGFNQATDVTSRARNRTANQVSSTYSKKLVCWLGGMGFYCIKHGSPFEVSEHLQFSSCYRNRMHLHPESHWDNGWCLR